MKAIRNTYTIGDRITLKSTAPKQYLDMTTKNPHFILEIEGKNYNGYNVKVINTRDNDKVINRFTVQTKHLSKGSTKKVLIQIMESLQTKRKKVVEEIDGEIEHIKSKLSIMDELGTDTVDDTHLEYARKFSCKMNVPLKDAYKAICDEA